jgi:hypothetical protein
MKIHTSKGWYSISDIYCSSLDRGDANAGGYYRLKWFNDRDGTEHQEGFCYGARMVTSTKNTCFDAMERCTTYIKMLRITNEI